MSLPESQAEQKYSYADYLTWPDDERIELIDGVPYDMTPAPTPKHQRILGELLFQFHQFLRNHSCDVYVAPLDVRLLSENKTDDEIYHVVQPDLIVVCDPSKVDDKGLKGSPDLAVEILSKSTAKKDKTVKKQLYEKAKINEFWIVDPLLEYVEVYLLNENNKYDPPAIYGNEDTIKVALFEQLDIDLTAIFAN